VQIYSAEGAWQIAPPLNTPMCLCLLFIIGSTVMSELPNNINIHIIKMVLLTLFLFSAFSQRTIRCPVFFVALILHIVSIYLAR